MYNTITIDAKELELYEDSLKGLNLINRSLSIDNQTVGGYSRTTLVVPATKANRATFNGNNEVYDIVFKASSQSILKGTAFVNKVNYKASSYGLSEDSFELNIVLGNANWILKLKGVALSELTNEVITWNEPNVNKGFISEPSTRNWAFALIKYKEWKNNKGTGTDFHYMPSVKESTPCLYVKPLIKEAFKKAGYKILGSFFESEEFSKLILPVPLPHKMPLSYGEKYANINLSLNPNTTISYSRGGFPTVVLLNGNPVIVQALPLVFPNFQYAPNAVGLMYDTTTGEYTAQVAGYYEVAASFKLPSPFAMDNNSIFAVQASVNNVLLPRAWMIMLNESGYPQNLIGRVRGSQLVFLNQGDILTISLAYKNNIDIDILECDIEIKAEAVNSFGSIIDFKYLLSDLYAIDLINLVQKMYNLSIFPDNDARTVFIAPQDLYTETSTALNSVTPKEGFLKSATIDRTSKVELTKGAKEIASPMRQPILFQYKTNEGATEKYINESNAVDLYSCLYTPLGRLLSKESIKVTAQGEYTIHTMDLQAKYPNESITPQFPLIYPQNYILDPTATAADNQIELRILYHAGQRKGILTGVDGYIELFEAQGLKTPVPATFMINYNDESGKDVNLGFNTVEFNGNRVQGLFEKYHAKKTKRQTSKSILQCTFRLSFLDKQNFTPRNRIHISGKNYVHLESTEQSIFEGGLVNVKIVQDANLTFDEMQAVETPISKPLAILI